jgi:hypothetical protein
MKWGGLEKPRYPSRRIEQYIQATNLQQALKEVRKSNPPPISGSLVPDMPFMGTYRADQKTNL